MHERPIPMSAPMVRAILAGTKTQTRRPLYVLTKNFNRARFDLRYPPPDYGRGEWPNIPPGHSWNLSQWRNAKPGDRLWVREAWRAPVALDSVPLRDLPPGCEVWHEATSTARTWRTTVGKLRPGMFMPRWASRITLRITDVRVERLQDISEADAIAEGIERSGECNWRDYLDHPHNDFTSGRRSYRSLWKSINGPGSWDANPWVWVLSFEREEPTR